MDKREALKALRIRLGIKGRSQSALLGNLLDDARLLILAYTRRDEPQWLARFDAVWIQLSAAAYQRLGAEGYQSRSEGGVGTAFIDGLPDDAVKALNPYRLIKGLV